jgi:hypothetical protein
MLRHPGVLQVQLPYTCIEAFGQSSPPHKNIDSQIATNATNVITDVFRNARVLESSQDEGDSHKTNTHQHRFDDNTQIVARYNTPYLFLRN